MAAGDVAGGVGEDEVVDVGVREGRMGVLEKAVEKENGTKENGGGEDEGRGEEGHARKGIVLYHVARSGRSGSQIP